jgi:hypothetical protein
MDFEQFRRRAELNQAVADYLDEIAQAADPDQAHRSVTLGILFAVSTYALYRLAKNYFDHQRGLSEAELRQEMLEQVEVLEKSGWDRDKALATVLTVSKETATLRPDSPALEAALALMKV